MSKKLEIDVKELHRAIKEVVDNIPEEEKRRMEAIKRFEDDPNYPELEVTKYGIKNKSLPKLALLRNWDFIKSLSSRGEDVSKDVFQERFDKLKEVLKLFRGMRFTREQMEDIKSYYIAVFGPAFDSIGDEDES